MTELGLTFNGGYVVTDLFDDVNYGKVGRDQRFKVDVNPSGESTSTLLVRARKYLFFLYRKCK